MGITVSSGLLKNEHRCLSYRKGNTVDLVSEKKNHYVNAVLMKETLKKFAGKSFTRSEVEDFVAEKKGELGVELEMKEIEVYAFLSEFFTIMSRYIDEENKKGFKDELDYELYPAEKVIDCFGLDVSTTPDCIFFKKDNSIEIVKYKYSKPYITQSGNVRDASAYRSLELYAMLRYGRAVAKEMGLRGNITISASYYYLKKKKDNASKSEYEPVYFSKSGSSVIFITEQIMDFGGVAEEVFGNNADDIFGPQFKAFIQGEDCLGSEHCDNCSFKSSCFYKDLPEKATFEELKKPGVGVKLTPNEVQSKAIAFNSGLARIIAGAGTGKTFVVKSSAVELIKNGVPLKDMLFITFTDAGAKEMKGRIENSLKELNLDINMDELKITTFNSFGYDVIKKEFAKFGFTAPPSVIDDIDKCSIIEKLLNDHYVLNDRVIEGLDLTKMNFASFKAAGAVFVVKEIFDIMKTYTLGKKNVEEILDRAKYKLTEEIILECIDFYDVYEKYCKDENLITYDDQETMLLELFKMEPEYVNLLGYKHIYVDEFQDTSERQLKIIKWLVSNKFFKSLMVVGDDSQAIFSFRNTSPKNIVNFFKLMNKKEKDFEVRKFGTKEMFDFHLLENYRSVPSIVNLANKINEINRTRVDKNLVAKLDDTGFEPVIEVFTHKDVEYKYIADNIEKEIQAGELPHNICVIQATRKGLLETQKLLDLKGIKTVLLNPEYVLENHKVLAFLKLADAYKTPSNTANYIDYINALTKGKYLTLSNEEKYDKISKLEEMMSSLNLLDENEKYHVFKNIALAIADDDELYEDFVKKVFRKRTLAGVIEYMRAFAKYGAFVTYKKVHSYIGAVNLCTAHSSKGLEWKSVYNSISDFHNTSFKDEDEEEEKRRLFFVAITRAREKLTITGMKTAYSKTQMVGKDKETILIPNMFLKNALAVTGKTSLMD